MEDKTLWQLIGTLSLQEKASLCSGADFWQTKQLPQREIPALRMADGPHGLRYEEPSETAPGGMDSREASCFPSACALACSFSRTLLKQVGAAIAEEARQNGVGLLLAPGVNMKRSPLCGRNFEYYAEDPELAGELAAAFIEGVQGQGVGACIKHFAVNNQEYLRASIDVAVDDRALFDFYLRAFEIAIQKSKPAAVMCSYNRLNGTYTANNRRLLFDILRLRFGFRGAVISDWGAEYNRVAGVEAGLDLEMPASDGENDAKIVQAVQSGALSGYALDTACLNVLRLVFSHAKPPVEKAVPPPKAHHKLAVKALVQSAVLLKNEGQLPFEKNVNLAVIGEMAHTPRYQGAGSSLVHTRHLGSFAQVLEANGVSHCYAPGYTGMQVREDSLAAAVQAAQNAQQVVLFLGLPPLFESEGFDREHLALPSAQLRVLEAVRAVNENICVVLCNGAPVTAPWLQSVKSLLCVHLGGEGLFEAVYKLLFGEENPSGKLAETWPLAREDTPCHGCFPMGPQAVHYRESLYVGYRYYNTAQKEVLFPFGHGLSYTTFHYACTQRLNAESQEELCFALWVKNTGHVAGEEVVQVYAAAKESRLHRPVHELVCFERVALPAGDEACVVLRIRAEKFAVYDKVRKKRVVEAGVYELQIGSSSRDIRLRYPVRLQGCTLEPAHIDSSEGPYGAVADNRFQEADFARLYARPMPQNSPPQKGHYTDTTPLGQMQDGFWGRTFLRLGRHFAKKETHFSQDVAVNEKVVHHVMQDMPLKNLPLLTQGRIGREGAEAMLALCNGHGGFLRLLKSLYKARKGHDKA